MEISNFSSLIEVGVALNIACVAIEYVKSYTDVLCNQVFNLELRISKAIKECMDKLNEVMDETTLAALPDTLAGGRSIVTLKRKLTNERNGLTSDIKKEEDDLKTEVRKVCEAKNISSVCLWLFLYGLLGLFLIGLENVNGDNFSIHCFWLVLTFCGTLFAVIGWFRNENERPWWQFDYCSLRFSLTSFIISVILSFITIFLLKYESVIFFLNSIWVYILIYSMFLIYSNFCVSVVEVWNKAKRGKDNIENKKNSLLERCNNWNGEAMHLQGALHVDEELSAEEGRSGIPSTE